MWKLSVSSFCTAHCPVNEELINWSASPNGLDLFHINTDNMYPKQSTQAYKKPTKRVGMVKRCQ